MMKISPFTEGKAAKMPDPERVNVWPLVYHNRDATSVLWPIVDWDAEGFAVRPLINKEHDDWSILFPLSAWNTTRTEGWALTAYHYDENKGMFPLFNLGDEFSYVIPAWWTDDDEHGVFPLYGWSDELHHVGPVWWETEGEAAGLFPLYDQDQKDKWKERNLLGGIVAHLKDADDGNYTHWIFPAWYARKREDGMTRVFFPVFAFSRDEDERVLLTPLGGRAWEADGEDEVLVVLPFFGYGRDDDRRVLLTPIGGRGWKKDGETYMVNVVGPLYHYHERGEHTFHAVLWPFFTCSDGGTWRLLPLMSHTGKRGKPGLLHELALISTTNTDKRKGMSVLGPFGFDYDRKLHDDARPDWDLSFLLFGRLWHRVYKRNDLPHPSHHSWQSHVGSKGRDFILIRQSTETFRVWRQGVLTKQETETLWRWWRLRNDAARMKLAPKVTDILKRHGVSLTDQQPETIRAALLAFAAENTELAQTTRLGIPLLYECERSGEKTNWKVLFGALSGNRVSDRTRVSVLRHLYRRERNGDNVSRDFFPFCTWDSTPDRTRFSFLWRLLNYERNGGRRNGHLLFIPWGK
ncbi:MAG: hypothetical protein HN742_34175 [Lentisphaerae bacterium]|jgi:hypothetical protein|nr:hypothetical protein [Lentisphaerota bacterium]MBT4819941.1 hypothetical protein [Lentisphaerota bacterium]MBT5612926.1 hypothetical protein [Lentisphaerota bacterium]MBT7061856.1 hypothetical protein [Lentisphaerota bacterium]MBT7846970.1 hypothetical protein [Lentisphaerota bacterium]